MIALTMAAGMAVALTMGGAEAAPSFNCKAASTPVERTICADTKLADLDQRVADAFSAQLGLADAASRERLRAEQKTWLGTVRNGCAGQAALGTCLAGVMDARAGQLESAMAQAVADVVRVVQSLPASPDAAARSLGERRGALGQAWLAYAQRYGARPDPTTAAATLTGAIGQIQDSYPQSIAKGQNLTTDEGFLTALRVVADDHDMAMPCFVLKRHGAAGWEAVQPIYGSSRDGAAPMPNCVEDSSPLDHPAWNRLEALLEPMMDAAYARTGTMRSSISRALAGARLKAAVEPRLFKDEAGAYAKTVAAVLAWKNPRWVGTDWTTRFNGALEEALTATAQALKTRYGMDPATARRTAQAVATEVLGIEVPFIEEYVVLTMDTRIPEWLRGIWVWDRGSGEDALPLREPRGRVTIDATTACVDGKEGCQGLELMALEDGTLKELLEAARTLAPQRTPAQPHKVTTVVSDQPDESFNALSLSDGSVLARTSGSRLTVLTRAK